MRLFVAVDPGPVVCEHLEQVARSLYPSSPGSKWVRACDAHITLAFLGEVEGGDVPAVIAAVEAAAQKGAPLALRFGGGGAFGPARRPRVLWAGVEGDVAALAALQKAVDGELVALGYRPEERAWTPHLTLARARDKRGDPGLAACAEALRGRALGDVRIECVTLYRSDLSPEGPRYTALTRAPLGPRP